MPNSTPSRPSNPPSVALGQRLPEPAELPTLDHAQALGGQRNHSRISAGARFEGQISFTGALTVAGHFNGRIAATAGAAQAHVTVAEGGEVHGEVHARSISVLGRTEGLLDAPGGRVSLHPSAVVHGQVRYGHLQVNGAELNARVERVVAGNPKDATPTAPVDPLAARHGPATRT